MKTWHNVYCPQRGEWTLNLPTTNRLIVKDGHGLFEIHFQVMTDSSVFDSWDRNTWKRLFFHRGASIFFYYLQSNSAIKNIQKVAFIVTQFKGEGLQSNAVLILFQPPTRHFPQQFFSFFCYYYTSDVSSAALYMMLSYHPLSTHKSFSLVDPKALHNTVEFPITWTKVNQEKLILKTIKPSSVLVLKHPG